MYKLFSRSIPSNVRIDMKQLGSYRKFVIIAAVFQSIIVVIAGYLLFKYRSANAPQPSQSPPTSVEQQAPPKK